MLYVYDKFWKTSSEITKSDPDTSLLDGPSVSGLASVTCAIGTAAVAAKCSETSTVNKIEEIVTIENTPNEEAQPLVGGVEPATTTTTTTAIVTTTTTTDQPLLPTTPNSTTSTAPLLSPPNSPGSWSVIEDQQQPATLTNGEGANVAGDRPATTTTMPGKMPSGAMVRMHSSSGKINENGLSISNKDLEYVGYYSKSPNDKVNFTDTLVVNTTTVSQGSGGGGGVGVVGGMMAVSAISPTGTVSSTSPSSAKSDGGGATSSTNSATPTKKKRNIDENFQSDINSIESISEKVKLPLSNLDWVDDLMAHSKACMDGQGTGPDKSMKKNTDKDANNDQLDCGAGGDAGLLAINNKTIKNNNKIVDKQSLRDDNDDDDKLVTCLHYTLMCCDCAIS